MELVPGGSPGAPFDPQKLTATLGKRHSIRLNEISVRHGIEYRITAGLQTTLETRHQALRLRCLEAQWLGRHPSQAEAVKARTQQPVDLRLRIHTHTHTHTY